MEIKAACPLPPLKLQESRCRCGPQIQPQEDGQARHLMPWLPKPPSPKTRVWKEVNVSAILIRAPLGSVIMNIVNWTESQLNQ